MGGYNSVVPSWVARPQVRFTPERGHSSARLFLEYGLTRSPDSLTAAARQTEAR